MVTYNYKKPSSINWVSIFLFLLLLGGIYGSWKFVPVYWQAYKVDEVLEGLKNQAADLRGLNDHDRQAGEAKLIDSAVKGIHELGIEDLPENPVRAYFSPGYGYIYADYTKIVVHPFVHKQTVINFHRKVKIPGDPQGL